MTGQSPYDALLHQMSQVVDLLQSQTSLDNTEARAMYDECARRIHLATVPDPLYRMETRPPAIDEALEAAREKGTSFIMIQRSQVGKMLWTCLPLDLVVLRTPTTQGDSPS